MAYMQLEDRWRLIYLSHIVRSVVEIVSSNIVFYDYGSKGGGGGYDLVTKLER